MGYFLGCWVLQRTVLILTPTAAAPAPAAVPAPAQAAEQGGCQTSTALLQQQWRMLLRLATFLTGV
jgi:hypothetical protein